MKNKWLLAISLVVLTGVIIGCTDTVTETGSGLPEEGFIKGTVTTARADGKPVTFTFEHTVRDYPTEFYSEYGTQNMSIYRAKDFLGDWTGDARSRMYFNVTNLEADTVNFFYHFYMEEVVALQNDTVMPWSFYAYNYPYNIGSITNFQYHESDNTITGSFHVTGNANSNGQPSTIDGSFKTKVRIIIDSGD